MHVEHVHPTTTPSLTQVLQQFLHFLSTSSQRCMEGHSMEEILEWLDGVGTNHQSETHQGAKANLRKWAKFVTPYTLKDYFDVRLCTEPEVSIEFGNAHPSETLPPHHSTPWNPQPSTPSLEPSTLARCASSSLACKPPRQVARPVVRSPEKPFPPVTMHGCARSQPR